MFPHLLEAALEERIGESEINSQNLETQTFDSDRSLFDSLPQTDNFSEYFTRFQLAALQEGWDIQVASLRKNGASIIIDSFVIRC